MIINKDVEIINGDCLEVEIKPRSFDLILTDPPYGVLNTKNTENKFYAAWDTALDSKELLKKSLELLRVNGRAIFFAQGEFTADLINSKPYGLDLSTRAIWLKDNWGSALFCKKALLSKFEDIIIFNKLYDDGMRHPLRSYSKKIADYIKPANAKQLKSVFGNRRLEHFFRWDSIQFALCTEESYSLLVDKFNLHEMPEFLPFSELKKANAIFAPVFNLQGKPAKSNVFEYKRENKRYHKTQKPVALLEDLIRTYTNEGDRVLDLTMGSGSTAIACIRTNRKFVGIEKDEEIFNVAKNRILSEIKAGDLALAS